MVVISDFLCYFHPKIAFVKLVKTPPNAMEWEWGWALTPRRRKVSIETWLFSLTDSLIISWGGSEGHGRAFCYGVQTGIYILLEGFMWVYFLKLLKRNFGRAFWNFSSKHFEMDELLTSLIFVLNYYWYHKLYQKRWNITDYICNCHN